MQIIKTIVAIVFLIVAQGSLTAQELNFNIESDYIEAPEKQTLGITSTLRKEGNNLIWTRNSSQNQGNRLTFFTITQTDTSAWNRELKTGSLSYRLEGNGIEGELLISSGNPQESNYTITFKITTYLEQKEVFNLHIISITFK